MTKTGQANRPGVLQVRVADDPFGDEARHPRALFWHKRHLQGHDEPPRPAVPPRRCTSERLNSGWQSRNRLSPIQALTKWVSNLDWARASAWAPAGKRSCPVVSFAARPTASATSHSG